MDELWSSLRRAVADVELRRVARDSAAVRNPADARSEEVMASAAAERRKENRGQRECHCRAVRPSVVLDRFTKGCRSVLLSAKSRFQRCPWK